MSSPPRATEASKVTGSWRGGSSGRSNFSVSPAVARDHEPVSVGTANMPSARAAS